MAEVAQDTKPIAAQTFRLRTQLLEKGRTHTILASAPKDRTNGMNIAIKCYAEGGENAFHAHDLEDHTFIVLQGRAQFYQPDSPPKDLGRNEGILIPAGALYKFESCGDEPLVLLRVGNVHQPVGGEVLPASSHRRASDGSVLHARSAENGHVEPVAIDGAWYE